MDSKTCPRDPSPSVSNTRGLWPNVTRTFLVNAAELGTYDEAKSRLVPILGDGFLAHVPWQISNLISFVKSL